MELSKKSAIIIIIATLVATVALTILFPTSAHAENDALIECVRLGTPKTIDIEYPVERYEDNIYIVHDEGNLWGNYDQYVIFNLDDEVNVVDVWDGSGLELDINGIRTWKKVDYPAFDTETKAFYFRAALNNQTFPASNTRIWAACLYFKLSDGRTIALIYDGSSHATAAAYPNTIELYDIATGEVPKDEFRLTGLYDIGNSTQVHDYSGVISTSLEVTTALNMRVAVEEQEYSKYDTYRIGNAIQQTWPYTFSCKTLVNGVENPCFDASTDLSSSYSKPFSLKPGINVVEIVISRGFTFDFSGGYNWFVPASFLSPIGIVYIIDYHGETFELPAEVDDFGIQEGSLAAYVSGATNSYFERHSMISDGDGGFVFSLPEAYKEAPDDINNSFSKGVIITAVPNDSQASVEILGADNLQAGNKIGACIAINPWVLSDNSFILRVTSASGTVKDYPVTIAFADSSTTVSDFSVSNAQLDENFSNEKDTYYIVFGATNETATLSFSLPDGAVATIDGQPANGTAEFSSSEALHKMIVTAPDGVTTKVFYFITKIGEEVPYFSRSDATIQQAEKLLTGYRNFVSSAEYFNDVWPIYMVEAAAEDIVDWNGKHVYNLEKNNPNRQATDPARAILAAILLGQNPYHFDADGDGTYRNFVDELNGWSSGGPWANNIWYNMAAKAVGLEPIFESSMKENAVNNYYDLDMRSWVITTLNHSFNIEAKNMVKYIDSLHNVQSTYENGLFYDERNIGLWRMPAGYGSDLNPWTIGCVLSAIASVGADPDILFSYSYNGVEYRPLGVIEQVLWDAETGMFFDNAGGPPSYAKDMIIGLGDIVQGSNVWDRLSLTEEKYAALLEKAAETGIDTASMPAYGDAGYGEAYYTLYAQVADKLEASDDTSMRPKVIWGMPYEIFIDKVDALPSEDNELFVEEVEKSISLFEALDVESIAYLESAYPYTMTAYRDAVAAALTKQDSTGDTADFYKRVMALPDALLITEDSREEVDALRALYDGMTAEQRDLIDWAGASVLLRLQAAEAALGQGSGSTTMTIHFALLGAPDDGPGGTVNTLKDGNLDTWLEDDYTFNAETISAEQAFRVIMGDAGISWKGGSSNSYGTLYVSAVKNPATGEWMEEFTTGENSGWMYTVNGLHPNMGLSAYMLADGDSFVFHYTDDFTLETDPWDGTIINDEEKTGATTVITDAATGTFVVECDRACAVLAKTEDGSYVLLPATVTPGADGDIVSFTAGDYDEVLIRVKGDLNGDGAVDSTDTLMMKKLVAGLMEPDEITALLMDLTGDGIANSTDTLKMKRVAAGLDTLAW